MNKKIVIGLVLSLFLLVGSVFASTTVDIYDGSGTEEGRALGFSNSADSAFAQRFYAIQDRVDQVCLQVGKGGTPTDGITVTLQTGNSSRPLGSLISASANVTLPQANIVNNAVNCFNFSTSVPVTVGVDTYWIVVNRGGAYDGSNYNLVYVSYADTYANGSVKTYAENTNTYSDIASRYDLWSSITFSQSTPYFTVYAQAGDDLTLFNSFNVTVDDVTYVTTNGSVVFNPILDQSGNNRTLTNNGAVYNDTSQSYIFNGNYLSQSDLDAGSDGDISVFATIYPTSNAGFYSIYNRWNGGYTNFILFDRTTSGNLRLFVYNDGVTSSVTSTGTTTVNQTATVGFTISGTTYTFYIDGVASGTGSLNSNYPSYSGTSYIGYRGDSGGDYWRGTMSMFYMRQATTDATEVLANYNNGGYPTVMTDIVAFYPFTQKYSNSSSNINVSVKAGTHYFNVTAYNWNITNPLTALLTSFPTVSAYDQWDNQSINATVIIDGNTYYTNNATAYVPFNESKTVQVRHSQYFNQTLTHDFSGYTNLNQSLFQAQISFLAYELVTGNVVTPFNVSYTDGIITKSITNSESIYSKLGIYTATFEKSDWFDLNTTVILSELSNTTRNFTGVYNNELTLNLTNGHNESQNLSDFSVRVVNSLYSYDETYNTSTDELLLPSIDGVSFNYTFFKTGYYNRTYLNQNSEYNFTGSLFPINSTYLRFYSASSGQIVNQTISVLASNSSQQLNFTVFNGQGVVEGLSHGSYYLFDITASGFNKMQYTRQIPQPDETTPYMDFYLVVNGTNITFTIRGTDSNPIENVLIEIEKFVNGTYQLVGSSNTDITGNAYMNQILSDTHKITISKTGYQTRSFIVPQLQTEYDIVLTTNANLSLTYDSEFVKIAVFPRITDINSSLGTQTVGVHINSSTGILSFSGIRVVNASNNSQTYYVINSTSNMGGTYTYELNLTQLNMSLVTLQYYYQIQERELLRGQWTYYINPNIYYTGTLIELRNILQQELSIPQQVGFLIVTFFVTMIILAVIVRGVGNIILTLIVTNIAAFLLGINLYVVGSMTLVISIIIFALVRSRQ